MFTRSAGLSKENEADLTEISFKKDIDNFLTISYNKITERLLLILFIKLLITEEIVMAKKETAVPEIIDNVEALVAKMNAMREAQKVFATYTQEQVDKIFKAAAIAANKERIPLAKMAVEETGMGIVEDKVIKNHYAAEYIYNKYKDEKTCGVIEEDKAFGIKRVAEPIGLIAAVIPTTNPTSTAIFKTLIALKTRNAIIISPHPRAKKSTIEAAKIVL